MPDNYGQWQNRLQAHHAELLGRYLDKPFSVRHADLELESELDEIERLMLTNPPRGIRRGLTIRSRLIETRRLPKPTALTLEDAGIDVLAPRDWPDLIEHPERTPPDKYVAGIFNQGSNGSCASESACGSVMCRRQQDGQHPVKLSPLFVYGRVNGGRDAGSSLDENISFMQKYGSPSMSVWPRSHGWREKPSDEAYRDALQYRLLDDGVLRVRNWAEFATLVLLGIPVYFGYSGHAIFSGNIVSATRLEYVNSWGNWGNNGRGTLSSSSIYWGYGAYGILSVTDKEGP